MVFNGIHRTCYFINCYSNKLLIDQNKLITTVKKLIAAY